MFTQALSFAVIIFAQAPDAVETLPVTLHNRTEIGETAVDELRTEVEKIFAPAGILLDWSPAETGIAVFLAPRPERKVITGCSRNLHDHRLGRASLSARRVTLWTEQTARATSGDWDSERPPTIPSRSLGRGLGRVLAHELGHLLLALNGHRSNGLMRASFKHRDLSTRSRKPFRLSRKDAERLREGVRVLQTGRR